MRDDLERVLIDRQQIERRVRELGAQISRDLSDLGQESVLLVPILTGSVIFVADLMRQITQKIRISVVTMSSYPGATTESRGPRLEGRLPDDLEGRHVLVVDDILDSGRTLRLIRDLIAVRHPRSLRTCVLLRKQRAEALSTPCDYVGFDIPDEFVVGYGLDYDDYYRNLPDIGTLRKDVLR
jgi:hypoxanthine phosphoribosyltransferase